MTVSILIFKEDIKKLEDFLITGNLEEIYWTDRTFFPIPDYLLINLNIGDYYKLVEVSLKIKNEENVIESEDIIEDINTEDNTDFKNLDIETLEIFNLKGLYSKNQLELAFKAGIEHLENLILQKSEQPFKNNTDFNSWYEKLSS
jgi:predicted RNA-binding protein associated with RNAse of E/G family